MNAEASFLEKAEAENDALEERRTPVSARVIAVGAAFVQAGCIGFIFLNGIRVWLGLAAIGAASGSFLHSDPVRYAFAAIALVGAALTLGTVLNNAYLRNRPEARWRKRTLTRKERAQTIVSVAVSLGAIGLVAAELWIHYILHSR